MHDASGDGLVSRFYESKEYALPKEFTELPQVPVGEGILSWKSDVINFRVQHSTVISLLDNGVRLIMLWDGFARCIVR